MAYEVCFLVEAKEFRLLAQSFESATAIVDFFKKSGVQDVQVIQQSEIDQTD